MLILEVFTGLSKYQNIHIFLIVSSTVAGS
jgi:hypothetical protein